MSLRVQRRDWLALLALVFIWGTAYAVIRVAVTSLTPLGVAAGRLGVAALALCAALRGRGARFPRGLRIWGCFLVLAILGNALPFFLVSWGQQRVPSGLVGIWMATNPLLTSVLAHVFLSGEPLTRGRALAVGLGFAGVCTLVGPDLRHPLHTDLLRQAAVFAAACCYSTNAILTRRLTLREPRLASEALPASACILLLASVLIAPAALAAELSSAHAPSLAALAAVLWLGLVPTAAGMLLYFRVIRSAGASFLSLAYYPIPLVAVACGALAFGERLGLHVALGFLLILASLALAELRRPAEPVALGAASAPEARAARG